MRKTSRGVRRNHSVFESDMMHHHRHSLSVDWERGIYNSAPRLQTTDHISYFDCIWQGFLGSQSSDEGIIAATTQEDEFRCFGKLLWGTDNVAKGHVWESVRVRERKERTDCPWYGTDLVLDRRTSVDDDAALGGRAESGSEFLHMRDCSAPERL